MAHRSCHPPYTGLLASIVGVATVVLIALAVLAGIKLGIDNSLATVPQPIKPLTARDQ
jgi:hypothetical protein